MGSSSVQKPTKCVLGPITSPFSAHSPQYRIAARKLRYQKKANFFYNYQGLIIGRYFLKSKFLLFQIHTLLTLDLVDVEIEDTIDG